MTKQQERILVVDDNDVNRLICEEILGHDYRLEMASDGESALAAAASFEPDLILLDVMMPGIDGVEVCRRLRRSSRPWVKILMVSARALTEDRLAAYEAGADDYVCKPFDEQELLAKVRVHLRLRRTEEIDSVKNKLLSVLQHGNRTPMTSILGTAELLVDMDGELSAETRREANETLLRSARRLNEWLAAGEQLVEFKSGRVEFHPQRVDVVELANGKLDRLANVPGFGDRLVTIEGPGSLEAECDPEHFGLLVDRLLRYTVAYSEPGAEAALRIEPAGSGRLRLTIIRPDDTVEPLVLEDLFEPFGATDDVLHNHGDGLGLALVKEAAALHNGLVRARRTEEGRIEVQAELPLTQEQATDADAPEVQDTAAG